MHLFHPKLVALFGLLLLTVACSGPFFGPASPGTYQADINQRGNFWEIRVHESGARVTFETQLAQGDRPRLNLKRPGGLKQIAYFELMDENCQTGHKGRLVYYAGEKKGFQSIYFGREVPWRDTINVDLRWRNGVLTVSVNDESHQVTLFDAPTLLQLSGHLTASEPLPLHYTLISQ